MIILTGGAGFIGSCFLKELNDAGYYDIIVVDNLGTGDKWKNLANKKFTQFIHKNDFRNIIANAENPYCSNNIAKHSFKTNTEAIIHLGACSSTVEKDANYLMDNNFLFSKEIAMFAIKHGIRFIYASSAATYGNGENGYSDKSIDGLVPLNCYGLSKHLFDMWIKQNKLENKVTGLKFFNVFGPNEYHKGNMRSMFMKSFEQIKETGKVKLFKSKRNDYKDGEQKRDFIYVKDCNKIMMEMLKNPSITGIYNLGTGKAQTWNTLAQSVFIAMNKEPNIEYIDLPTDIANQYQYFTQAETTKLMTALGENWEFTTIQDAANDYIREYLEKNTCM